MPHRHTIYFRRSVADLTPETLFKEVDPADWWMLGEDYGLSDEAVNAALPLRIESLVAGRFLRYRLFYGAADKRPIEFERWETDAELRGAVAETIDNLTVRDEAHRKKLVDLLRTCVDSVSVSFGTDPPASMFAWEAVRYLAKEFEGLVHPDDGEWLTIDRDWRVQPI